MRTVLGSCPLASRRSTSACTSRRRRFDSLIAPMSGKTCSRSANSYERITLGLYSRQIGCGTCQIPSRVSSAAASRTVFAVLTCSLPRFTATCASDRQAFAAASFLNERRSLPPRLPVATQASYVAAQLHRVVPWSFAQAAACRILIPVATPNPGYGQRSAQPKLRVRASGSAVCGRSDHPQLGHDLLVESGTPDAYGGGSLLGR